MSEVDYEDTLKKKFKFEKMLVLKRKGGSR